MIVKWVSYDANTLALYCAFEFCLWALLQVLQRVDVEPSSLGLPQSMQPLDLRS